MEVDARANTFQQFDDYGGHLILNSHYMSDDIKDKLDDIQETREQLEEAYKERKEKLDQCLELQLFIKDCETAEQWMKSREDALKEDAKPKEEDASRANVEAAIKRHEDFDRAINAQEEKIANLRLFAETFIANDHYDKENVAERITQVLDRWEKLRNALIEHRSKLGESQTLQDFSRDADEIEAWILEKLQVAADESIKDVTNIQVNEILNLIDYILI
jgi:spectrin alpha